MKNKRKPSIVAIIGAYPDIGKGIFAGSICYLLQESGLSVSPIKFDGYINYSTEMFLFRKMTE